MTEQAQRRATCRRQPPRDGIPQARRPPSSATDTIKGRLLLGNLPHHRAPDGGRRRGYRLGGLHDLGHRLLPLADLANRPIRDRDHQNRGGYDRPQNACYFFRIHCTTPAASRDLIAQKNTRCAASPINGSKDKAHPAPSPHSWPRRFPGPARSPSPHKIAAPAGCASSSSFGPSCCKRLNIATSPPTCAGRTR